MCQVSPSIAEKPHNPMVNTGSILVSSLLQTLMKPDMSTAEKFDYINDYIKVRPPNCKGVDCSKVAFFFNEL